MAADEEEEEGAAEAGAEEPQGGGPVSEWSVVHSRVIFRDTPSTKGEVVGLAQWGQIVRGVAEDVAGTKWLRVRATDVLGQAIGQEGSVQWEVMKHQTPVRREKFALAAVMHCKAKGTLVFGKQEGDWVSLRPPPGYIQREFLRAAADRVLWMMIDGRSLGLGELLRPVDAPATEEASGDFEVRRVPGRGLGLFATRPFKAGEVVLQEKPFWTRPQPEAIKKCKALFKNEWAAAFNRIKETIVYPGDDAEAKIYASPAMVRNALGYASASALVRRKIHAMHCPELDCGHPIVTIAGRVAALCIERLEECRGLDALDLQRAMLCIEMNIFTGGRCFTSLARLNHSCCPNVVYIGMHKNWCFKALRDIEQGEELLQSYLGKELLLPSEVRRRLLYRSKCFLCMCERCAGSVDPMRAVPCRWCSLEQAELRVAHSPGVWLREGPLAFASKRGFLKQGTALTVTGGLETTDWVSGDWLRVKVKDEEDREGWVLTHGRSLDGVMNLGTLVADAEEGRCAISENGAECRSYWTEKVDFLAAMEQAGSILLDEDNGDGTEELSVEMDLDRLWLPPLALRPDQPFIAFHEGRWHCSRCKREPEAKEELLATERLLGRLAEQTFFSPEMTPALGAFSGKKSGLKMVKVPFIQKATELAISVTGVLGCRHWAFHWAQILFVDLLISRLQIGGLRKPHVGWRLTLQVLEDLWYWLSHMQMAQDPGCFLHSRVSEALRLVREDALEEGPRACYWRLKGLLDASSSHIEILPFKPLIVDGTVSFQ